MDKNQDGRVAIDELHPILGGAIARSDLDANGEISLAEYIAFDLDPGGAGRSPLDKNVRLIEDIAYADTDDPRQQLDVYLPKTPAAQGALPVIAYIHGGGWSRGSKVMGRTQLMPLVSSGNFAAVSIGYRLSWQDSWPAQLHDVKAAIRWIRANAEQYGFDASRICAMGASAGGHLAAMLGTTNGVQAVEGELGPHLQQPSDVQCAVDYFGPADLRASPLDRVDGVVGQLLGGNPTDLPEVAAEASPLLHVDASDPPFYIVHGTADPLVQFDESVTLQAALSKVGVQNYFQVVDDGGHGNFGAAHGEVERRLEAFLQKILLGSSAAIPTDRLSAGLAKPPAAPDMQGR